MSDRQLRALEQQWLETGAPEDGARYLSAQVRTGVLPLVNLKLAAQLGHPIAIEAMREHGAIYGPENLRQVGQEAAVRLGAALVGQLLVHWGAPDDTAQVALAATVDWIRAPGDRGAATQRVYRRCRSFEGLVWEPLEHLDRSALTLRLAAGVVAMTGQPTLTFPRFEEVLGAVVHELGRDPLGPEIARAVQAEFVPWLLGASDPVSEAVEVAT